MQKRCKAGVLLIFLLITTGLCAQRSRKPDPVIGTQMVVGFRANSNLVMAPGGFAGARWSNYAAYLAYEWEHPASGPQFHLIGPMADYFLAEHPRKDWVVIARVRCLAGIGNRDKDMAVNEQYGQAGGTAIIGYHKRLILKLGMNLGTVYHFGNWHIRAGLGPAFNWMEYVRTDNRIQLKLVPAGEMMLGIQYEF